jgi:hypothetical protein
MMPVKDPHARTQPLALANGHGRHMAVSPERTLAHSRCGCNFVFVTVPLPKRLRLRLRDGRFTSETATWIQKLSKKSVGASRPKL